MKSPLGSSFCLYCEEGALGRELNDTHWHRIFFVSSPQGIKYFVSKLGRGPIQLPFKMLSSVGGVRKQL